MRTISLVGLIGIVISLGTTDLCAQGNSGRGRGSAAARSSNGASRTNVAVDISSGNDQLRLIRAWFADSHNLEGLPPGLAKRETLPPGLQRQLQRNGTLPPGLQGKVYAVPISLERQLPNLRDGLSRVFVGGSIVLLDGNVILDIAAIF
jgi:hypothetical protein